MTFADLFESLPGVGWLTEDEARALCELPIQSKKTKDCLEVGCYHGRSSVLLAQLFRHVHCVDPFFGFDTGDPTGEKAMKAHAENMASRGLKNYTLHQMPIEEWIPQPLEFAYLDGDHTFSGTIRQIKAALNAKVRVIAIHDVNDGGGGLEVRDAALKMLGKWSKRVERIAIWQLH